MDAKMPMTISALGLEPPKASLLRRFRDDLEPLGALLGLRGLRGGAPLARPAHPRQIVEDVDVEDVEDVEDAEDVEDVEDVEDIEVGEDRDSTPPSTDFSKGRMQGEQGED